MRYKCDKKFPFMHIKLALKSHFNLMDSFWEIPKKVENGCNFEGGRLTYKTKPFPSLNTWIYCLNTIFFMVHLALPLFFSILSSSSIFSKVAFFKNHRPKHLNWDCFIYPDSDIDSTRVGKQKNQIISILLLEVETQLSLLWIWRRDHANSTLVGIEYTHSLDRGLNKRQNNNKTARLNS